MAEQRIRLGHLLDDDIICKLIETKLSELTHAPLLFDGFPRTLRQAQKLSSITHMTAVVNLEVPRDVIMARILNRWIHEASGRTYHDTYNPPKVLGKDDLTGEDLIRRMDDNQETILTRMLQYEETIKPLLEYYTNQGITYTMTGRSSDEIYPVLKQMVIRWMKLDQQSHSITSNPTSSTFTSSS